MITVATAIKRPLPGHKVRTECGNGTVTIVKSFEVVGMLLPDKRWIKAYLHKVDLMSLTPWNVFTYMVEFEDGSLAVFNCFGQCISVQN